MHTIGPNYTCVAKHSLWEIRNIVMVKNDLVGFIHAVDVQTVATGIANTLGNKVQGYTFALTNHCRREEWRSASEFSTRPCASLRLILQRILKKLTTVMRIIT